jgi:hypothetical protein
MVVNNSGGCIPNATVEVIGGQALGQRLEQSTPCDVWDVQGGFLFRDVLPNVAMTLRATASGYAAVEETFVPLPGPGYRAVVIELR